jgi:uncharacterized protein (TIGR02271 family)
LVTNESGYTADNYDAGQVWEIDHGYDVFAADGEKVGDVQDVQPHYLTVSKGFFFPTERYVPVAAITDVRDERVYLNVTKDHVESQNWETVPTEPTYTTDTTTYSDMDRTRDTDTMVSERMTDTTEDDVRIPVMEEQLSVGKHEVRRGLVRVHKTVSEEQASVNVPLREETVRVERHAVSGDYSGTTPTDAFQETEIDIPLRGEEADISKRAVVREEVEIHKDVTERNQQVSDTVRREEVHLHGADGELNTTDTTMTGRTGRTTGMTGMTGMTDTEGDDLGEGALGRLEDRLDPSPNEGGKPRGI